MYEIIFTNSFKKDEIFKLTVDNKEWIHENTKDDLLGI